MKKCTLLIVVILTITIVGSASAGMRPQFGIKAGVAWADQTWEYSSDFGAGKRDARSGMTVGAFADFSLAPAVSFQPELLYVQKGNQIDVRVSTYSNMDAGTRTYKDQIDYLSILTLLKVQTTGTPFGVYMLAGPRIDLKLRVKFPFDAPEYDALSDAYKSTVPGATIGVGIQRAFGSFGPVMLEARYDIDFGEAAEYVGEENTLTIDNREFAILVGLVL